MKTLIRVERLNKHLPVAGVNAFGVKCTKVNVLRKGIFKQETATNIDLLDSFFFSKANDLLGLFHKCTGVRFHKNL